MAVIKPPLEAWGKLGRMRSLSTVLFVVVGVIAVLAALFALLNLRTSRTYRPTVDQIVSILDAVLARRVTYREWDEFICVPIRHNADLERVRLECVALETESYLDKSRAESRGVPDLTRLTSPELGKFEILSSVAIFSAPDRREADGDRRDWA
jgi:hypothetical protein